MNPHNSYFRTGIIVGIAICLQFGRGMAQINEYPDEKGFIMRVAPMLQRIAGKGFGERSLSISECPDTGLPVKTWALEGETVISPYTGRAYVQGPTGYFGPKERDEEGRVIRFGGDPLKYDLAPATAALLLDNGDINAKAFVAIPGNLNQQYHFACKSWARFYPMLADAMGPEWKRAFQEAVANYEERRRPSDGAREYAALSSPHNLVGQAGYLLGGNPTDGGTENHKTMWRTSALLYSQLFPDSALISGKPAHEAGRLTKEMIRDYLERLLLTGNGEYDSQVYYPHSIEAFMNLYDFSPDEETRILAKFALDYYFITYGLKVIDGTIAGAQKRGYLPNDAPGEMEIMLWAFFNHTSRNMNDAVITIQQATTSYRPNNVIWNIVRKNVPLPFEAKMSRPFYHMDRPHAFAETFYCSESYALGSIQMTIVDNPNQQMVWSLVAKGREGPLAFSGGQPLRGSTSGHSPYTQVLQSKGALIVLTAPTGFDPKVDTTITPDFPDRMHLWHMSANEHGKNFEARDRQRYGANALHSVPKPDVTSSEDLTRFWEESKGSASSWFYYPGNLQPEEIGGYICFKAAETFLALRPVREGHYMVSPSEEVISKMGNSPAGRFFRDYGLVVFPGEVSGFVLETAEASDFSSLEGFVDKIREKTEYRLSGDLLLDYRSLQGDQILMHYNPAGLRCKAVINGAEQDFDHFTGGASYESPYVNIKNGAMSISDGKDGYQVTFRDGLPVWEILD